MVQLAEPNLDTRSTIDTDPLRNFKFIVSINHTVQAAGSSAQTDLAKMGFMSVSGLSAENSVIAYREGGYNTALTLDSGVLTTNGWKKMRDIEIGDRVIDPMGEDSKVVRIFPAGVKSTYRLTLGDGSSVDACWGHLWQVSVRDFNNNWSSEERISTLMVKELVEKGYHVLVPQMQPFQYAIAPELPLAPYLLGLYLAEGSYSEAVTFACGDEEIVESIRGLLPAGHELKNYKSNPHKYAISVGNDAPGARNVPGRNKIALALRELGLQNKRSWEKSIPEMYLRASIEDRLALLQGYMDGDGNSDKGSPRFSTSSEQLAEDVKELVCSLGGRVKVRYSDNNHYSYKGERRKGRPSWSATGFGAFPFNPFRLTRKAVGFKSSAKTDAEWRSVQSVEHIGSEEVQCIEVSASSHMFITDHMIPTSNTQQKMPGQTEFPPLTMSKGVILGRGSSVDWLLQIFSVIQGGGTFAATGNSDFRATVDIKVLAHPHTLNKNPPVKAWFKVHRAWPQSVSYSDLDAGGNAIHMEQMVLQHEGWEVKFASGNRAEEAEPPRT